MPEFRRGRLVAEDVDVPRLLRALGIEAKKHGREWRAICPNPKHNDHDPSWRIRDQPGHFKHAKFKCHPCGVGGGPISLVMLVHGLGPREAGEWLRAHVGGEVAEEPEVEEVHWIVEQQRSGEFRLPDGVVVSPLDEWPEIVADYARRRGITAAQVDRWGIGYAVEGVLAGRVVLVARDASGRPRTYSARAISGSMKRYMTPDRAKERPDLSAMFGEQHWPEPTARRRAVVVEGAIDGLAVERATGLPFAILDGSQVKSNEQLARVRKLSTFPELVMLTDPDASGNGAAEALSMGLGRWTRVLRARLPEGVDAQQLESDRGPEALARVIMLAREER